MLTKQRVIFSDNGTLSGASKELNDLYANTFTVPVVAAEDYLYIGSNMPFNNRYFITDTANAQASIASVELWSGSVWESAVDIVDYTSVGGASMAQSGHLVWSMDRNQSWVREETTENVTGLTTLRLFDFYWMRIAWSADFDVGTKLKYVGYKFSDDNDLGGQYPDLVRSDVIAGWKTGKTDWEEQHIIAAEELLRILRKKHIIENDNQIYEYEQFSQAGAHKCAEVIFNGFGDEYRDNRNDARKSAENSIEQGVFYVDRDGSGRLDTNERFRMAGIIRR